MNRYGYIAGKYARYVVILLIFFILFCIIGLAVLKKDPASGRILIWKNSIEMIKDKPLLGRGSGAFSSEYMLYQADYFANHPKSKYIRLADNVIRPFNEFLLLSIEYGIAGVLFLSAIAIIVLLRFKSSPIPVLCLLSVAVFSCFSYPLRYPFIWILIAYSLAIVSDFPGVKSPKIWIKPLFLQGLFFCSVTFILFLLIRDIRFEYAWKKLTQQVYFSQKEELIRDYSSLYAKWNRNRLFLYNYAAVLSQLKEYPESNILMHKCEGYLNDYDVQMTLGEIYCNLRQWKVAEKYYIQACGMIPNRFLPLYRLLEMYDRQGRNRQALEIARTIIGKEIKIPSRAVQNMIDKAQAFIDSFQEEEEPEIFNTQI